MPYDGSGNFVRSFPPGGWQGDATGGIKILASRHDQHDNDIAAALSLALTRDGQSMPSADINWNGKKIINLAAPIAGTDAANKAYVDGIRNFSSPIVITGSHPNSVLQFTGTTGPWGNSYVNGTISAGARSNTWVWNDKADFSGVDVMTLATPGFLTVKGANPYYILDKTAAGGSCSISGRMAGKARWGIALGDTVAEAGANAGSDFRIYRYDDAGAYIAAAMTIDRDTGDMGVPAILTANALVSGGNITAAASVFANSGYVIGNASLVIIGTSPGGSSQMIYLRPVAYNSGSGQVTINAGGTIDTPGSVTCNGAFIAGDYAVNSPGSYVSQNGGIYTSTNLASSVDHHRIVNNSGIVGTIRSLNTGTSYNTASDENLKEYNSDMDPADAIAVIRADPVLAFTWKSSGEKAIGWFAQRSYAVDPNLASPPSAPTEIDSTDAKPGDPDYIPWGIDYGRRTPYLWAAVSNVLDRLEALEAKLSITDPKPPAKEAA